jgi:uncharacterized repeat protein (TIGR03803 family)
MRGKTLSIFLAILAVTVFATSVWAATAKVLHNFTGTDGANPSGGLIFDASGNLYGTTYYGGSGSCYDGNGHGCGTVFELTPKAGGGWAEKVLRNFSYNNQGGIYPSDGLIFDAQGNLYGTTGRGGGNQGGAVFELSRKAGGGWTEKVLYSFAANPMDRYWPRAGLIFDSSGNLYGTTYYGGYGISCHDGAGHGCGTVFELKPKAGGGWTEKILHRFNGNGDEGIWPAAKLIFDASGNLYGTTVEGGGGHGGYGTVFELKPTVGGGWGFKVLHSFNGGGHDGNTPSDSVIFDAFGNLYGTTYYGPPQGYNGPCHDGTDLGCGTVFELTPKVVSGWTGGSWTEKILHFFNSQGKDGFHPVSRFISDAFGNLYSTTAAGGANDEGTVFEMTRKAGGGWAEKVLHNFNYTDGSAPDALIFAASGNLYGTTYYGGNGNCQNGGGSGCGAVFEITP